VPYWDAVSPATRWQGHGCPREAAAQVRTLLTAAVVKRCVADVPVGVFLSGGLDSTAVVALMAAQQGQAINTFSIGIKDGPGSNELPYARQVAGHFQINHQELLIGRQELEDYLPHLVHTQDEPLADPVCVPLYYLARLARQTGTIVVQVGEGSDEQFLGYDHYVRFFRNQARYFRRLMKLPRALRRAAYQGARGLAYLMGRGGDRLDLLRS